MAIPQSELWRIEELEQRIRHIKDGPWNPRAEKEVRYLEREIDNIRLSKYMYDPRYDPRYDTFRPDLQKQISDDLQKQMSNFLGNEPVKSPAPKPVKSPAPKPVSPPRSKKLLLL